MRQDKDAGWMKGWINMTKSKVKFAMSVVLEKRPQSFNSQGFVSKVSHHSLVIMRTITYESQFSSSNCSVSPRNQNGSIWIHYVYSTKGQTRSKVEMPDISHVQVGGTLVWWLDAQGWCYRKLFWNKLLYSLLFNQTANLQLPRVWLMKWAAGLFSGTFTVCADTSIWSARASIESPS